MSRDAQAKTERMILGECPLPKETRIIEICPFHWSGNPFLPITVEYKIDIGPQISAHQPQLPHDFPLFTVNQTTTWRFSSNHAGGVKGINNGGNQFCVLVTFHTDKKKRKKKWKKIYYISTIGVSPLLLPPKFAAPFSIMCPFPGHFLERFGRVHHARWADRLGGVRAGDVFGRKKQKSPLNASGDQFVLHGGSTAVGWRTWKSGVYKVWNFSSFQVHRSRLVIQKLSWFIVFLHDF